MGITDGWASLVLHVASDLSLSKWPLQQGPWTFYMVVRVTEAQAARPSQGSGTEPAGGPFYSFPLVRASHRYSPVQGGGGACYLIEKTSSYYSKATSSPFVKEK